MCVSVLLPASAVLEAVLGVLPWMTTRWQCAATFELKVIIILQLLFLSFQGIIPTSTQSRSSPLQSTFSRTPPPPATSVEAPRGRKQAHYLVVSEVVGASGTRVRPEMSLRYTLPGTLHFLHPPPGPAPRLSKTQASHILRLLAY